MPVLTEIVLRASCKEGDLVALLDVRKSKLYFLGCQQARPPRCSTLSWHTSLLYGQAFDILKLDSDGRSAAITPRGNRLSHFRSQQSFGKVFNNLQTRIECGARGYSSIVELLFIYVNTAYSCSQYNTALWVRRRADAHDYQSLSFLGN